MVKFVKIDDCVKRDTGEVGVLDFDPFLNGQDGEVKGLKTQVVKRDEDRATVEATFHSLGQKQSILFDMILEGNAWRINDIRSLDEKKQRTSLYAALAEAYPDKSTACAKKHSKE